MARVLQASRHAEERIKERMGISGKKQIKEVVQNSYKNGISFHKHYIPKDTLKWISYKVNDKYFGRCDYRIYRNCLFLYAKNLTVVTVIEIPKHLQIKKNKDELIKGFMNKNK